MLAEGRDPIRDEPLPDASPYNRPEVIRALFSLLEESVERGERAERSERGERKRAVVVEDGPLSNHGKAWKPEDRALVATMFKQDVPLPMIAEHLRRTIGAVRGELIKQGLIRYEDVYPGAGGMPRERRAEAPFSETPSAGSPGRERTRPWTAEDDLTSATMFRKDAPIAVIAEHLQRPVGVVRSALLRQGLLRFDDVFDAAQEGVFPERPFPEE